jgi:hypothetical protein
VIVLDHRYAHRLGIAWSSRSGKHILDNIG